jgi:hypothetical protein
MTTQILGMQMQTEYPFEPNIGLGIYGVGIVVFLLILTKASRQGRI